MARKKKERKPEPKGTEIYLDGERLYLAISDGIETSSASQIAEFYSDSDESWIALSDLREYIGRGFSFEHNFSDEELIDGIENSDEGSHAEILGIALKTTKADSPESAAPGVREQARAFVAGLLAYEADEVLKEFYNGRNPSPTDIWMFRMAVEGAGFGSLLKGEN
jgi:hypothetical protein